MKLPFNPIFPPEKEIPMAKQKMAVVCNGDTAANIMPTLIFSTSGIALDYEVHVFVCPAGYRWFLKGEL
jgi:peroxiredoxin family protein